MSRPRITLLRGNDQVLELPGLRTAPEPSTYLNAATVVAVLWTVGITPVQVLSIPLTYVPASDGTYQGSIDGATFMEAAGSAYELVVTAAQTGQNYRIVYGVDIVDTA